MIWQSNLKPTGEPEPPAEFAPDAYLEKLLALRESDYAQFSLLPDAIKKIVEEYERDKAAAKRKE